MSIQKRVLLTGAVIGGVAVAIGAFGAHALKGTLAATGKQDTFELATRYQFYHALALLIMGALTDKLDVKKINWSAHLITLGIIVFSGSLYTLSISGIALWGAVTPIGGIMLLLGWLMFIMALRK